MVTGVLLGFGAATAQSISYIFSRMFMEKREGGAALLLAVSHLLMAAYSLAIIPFVWPDEMPSFGTYGPSMIGCALFYFFGQFCFFMSLRTADASRVSPLLGIKIVYLAVFSYLILGDCLTLLQIAAVALGVAAALALNWTGGKMARASIFWLLMACLGYSLSDVNIKILVQRFPSLTPFESSLMATCLCYLVCGAVVLLATPFFIRKTNPKMFVHAAPFSVAWYVAMILLFACFAHINVVFGNIIQSSRGIISIILGAVIARCGYEYLEEKTTRSVLARRIAAAALMMLAVALFVIGRNA